MILIISKSAPHIAYQLRGMRLGRVVWVRVGDALAAKQAALLAGDRAAIVINFNSFWSGLVAGVLSVVVLLALVSSALIHPGSLMNLLNVGSPEVLFARVMLYVTLIELLTIPIVFLKKGSPEFYILFGLAGLLIGTLFLKAPNLGIGVALIGFWVSCFLLSMFFKK